MSDASVSLLFPAYNRLAFTKQAWWALQANTDWELVKEFHVYDDGSTDGTREWLERQPSFVQPIFHRTSFRSPMGVTLDWIRRADAPLLAKLDNDTIYPPDWLATSVDIMDRYPDLAMLGLECMRDPVLIIGAGKERMFVLPVDEPPIGYGFQFGFLPATFISGLGIYRASAFKQSLPEDRGYFGLEEWQMAQRGLKYGWILPSLPTILLDRMRTEPWRSLSEEYVRLGWQREWSGAGPLRYKPEEDHKWEWWTPYEEREI